MHWAASLLASRDQLIKSQTGPEAQKCEKYFSTNTLYAVVVPKLRAEAHTSRVAYPQYIVCM